MREEGLSGVSRRRGTRTTRPEPGRRAAADLVERHFHAEAPDRLWVADITYVPTWAGFVFLAVVLDVYSRRIVGWAMQDHLRTELVLEALNMAVRQRRPQEVIHHSDQGTQYTSVAFGKRCRERGCQKFRVWAASVGFVRSGGKAGTVAAWAGPPRACRPGFAPARGHAAISTGCPRARGP